MEGRLVLVPQDDAGWLRLVGLHPQATPFHLPAWSQVIGATYGFSSWALVGKDADGVTAGVPVIEVSSPFTRPRLVALPFTDHCAPLAQDVQDLGAALLEWPGIEIRTDLAMQGVSRQVIGSRHILDLEPDAGSLFRRLDKNRVQRRVRRSRELGVTVTMGTAPSELEAFYSLHCDTRRRQGVPVQPKRFIQNIWKLMLEPGLGFVVTARFREKPIAAALYLASNRNLIYKFGASDKTHWNLGANFLVHWTAMEWGCAQGFAQYDFGRTDAGHEGLRTFKALWGATEVPLAYSHVGPAVSAAGERRGAGALANVIRHSPTVVCRALGELLYRYAA